MFSWYPMETNENNDTKNALETTRWRTLISTALLIVFATKTALCGIDLEIVQTINDSNASQVSKMLETENGKNVSLTCKIINSEGGDCGNKVVWGKKGKGHRFNNEILGLANLNFTPIGLKNRGTYFCASLKHGLYKTIFITVKPLKELQTTLTKRCRRQNFNSYAIPTSQSNYALQRQTESPRVIRLEDLLKKKVVVYDDRYKNTETFSEKVKEYAKVIAPLLAVMLIVSTLLYYLMKQFYLCVTPRERHSKKGFTCPHSNCKHFCTVATKQTVQNDANSFNLDENGRVARTEREQGSNTNPNYEDDTFIFPAYLFIH